MLLLGERGNAQTAWMRCQKKGPRKGCEQQGSSWGTQELPPALGMASLEQVSPAGPTLSSPQGTGCRQLQLCPHHIWGRMGHLIPHLWADRVLSPVTCRGFYTDEFCSLWLSAPLWDEDLGTVPDGDTSSPGQADSAAASEHSPDWMEAQACWGSRGMPG